MRRIRSVGLVCAGPISRGTVARLPGVLDHIGWVKAPSFRLASRAVNVLRAGEPVHTYEQLAPAPLILVSVPHNAEDCTIAEMAASRLDWRSRAVVIVDTVKESSAVRPLRDRGALLATLMTIGVGDVRGLFIEGHQEAIRLVHRVFAPEAQRAMHAITTAGKQRLLAGIDQATRGFLPVIASVTDDFKASGLSKQQAEALAQALMTSSMRSYFRAGRRVLD
jgi:hypothetical protein